MTAASIHFGDYIFHCRIEIRARRVLADIGAEQVIEQHVAGLQVVVGRLVDTVLEQHLAAQPQPAGGRRGLAHVVRLVGADGHDGVGAGFECSGHREFQLAGLVAAGCEPGAVVPLDPDLRPAEVLAQPRQVLERRRQVRERYARES